MVGVFSVAPLEMATCSLPPARGRRWGDLGESSRLELPARFEWMRQAAAATVRPERDQVRFFLFREANAKPAVIEVHHIEECRGGAAMEVGRPS